MIVRQILGQKTVAAVETIAPDRKVRDAARQLAERGIGALIVSADGQRVAGIISERDIVREIGRRGPECLDEPVEALMTRKVSSCAMGDTAEEILTRMTEGRFRHMPVLEDGRLVGVISIGDVVKARLAEIEGEKHALEDMIRGF
ncbi:MAG: CBS domain-containing protein [Alphaproteobacteria bacterium]|nr:MAG: CBS domain-containing protein [Alphaproteobacteria bacterium]